MNKDYKLYIVGGYVRDMLLGLESKDVDYAFEFNPEYVKTMDFRTPTAEYAYESMNAILEFEGFQIYKEHPDCFTTKAKFPPDHEYAGQDADIVMCRKETYPDPESRKPLVELGTLYDDLKRRDFTCNAIAIDSDGSLIDPFNGQQAIRDRTLECPIDAHTSFMDDPLRAMRCLRFALTKEFWISDDCMEALQNLEMWEKFDLVVSRERVRNELFRMMKFDTFMAIEELGLNLQPDVIRDYIFKSDIWLEPTTKSR